MSCDALTRDNPLLSRPNTTTTSEHNENGLPTLGGRASQSCEINFTTGVPDIVSAYVEASLSEATRKAYRFDLEHFEAWGGRVPASDTMVARYLAEHAGTLSVATLARRLGTISKAHTAKGLPSPTVSELVQATMRGIKRSRGTAQVEAKSLLRDDLFAVLEHTGEDIKSVRDRALLLIGFAGGFRRSELVGLNVGDIEHVRHGMIVHLRRSKTDQSGFGRKIAIPFGRTRWCPVGSVDDWLARAAIAEGPLFRPVSRHSRVLKERLSGEAVGLILRDRLTRAALDASGYSGHSLRAGFATSAAVAGASTWKIRAQTGHASDAMLSRYIRDGDIFTDNAAGRLL